MQLITGNCTEPSIASVRTMLSAATCTLLMTAPAARAGDSNDELWQIDAGAMHYSEDERITVNEGTLRLRRQFDEDSSLLVRSGYDSVTGSSPTGAVKIQTTTSASGSAYLASFETKRASIGADWNSALTKLLRLTINADHSTQSSYASTGIGATLARDFNLRNTTVIAGIGYSLDKVTPETGIHYGLQSVADTTVRQAQDEKDQVDLQLGITQVLARGTLGQLNYVHSRAGGYMSNPYKIVSVVNETTGSTVDYSPLYEKRPRSRDMDALYAQLNQSLGKGYAYLSYRYFRDDWGINGHTVDLKYRLPVSQRLVVQPHVRYYQQTAADFYRSMLTNTEVATLPEFASADYRLNELVTTTVGLMIGYRTQGDGELSIRLESIRQDGEEQPGDAIGIQRDEGVFPELQAVVVNVDYSVSF